MNMLGDKINDQIDDAVGDAIEQIDEENIKRRIKHIDAEPVSFEISEYLQPYTSISSQLKIINDVNTANIVLHPDGTIESKTIQNQNLIETSIINVNNELNVTEKTVLLGDTYVSLIKPLLTDLTNTISINGNLKIDSDKAVKTNKITALGTSDTLLVKAPYITFEIDPIVYNVVENPFDSLNPAPPQTILFKQVPQIYEYAEEPSLDVDIPNVKYVKTKVNDLKTNLENEVRTNSVKTNSINTKGERDELVIKAPYLTFDIDPIVYDEVENPFDTLNPAPLQMILFGQVPKIDPYADNPSLDIDITNVKYVNTKLNELKTDIETKLNTTESNVEDYKIELDNVKDRVSSLEESVTSINNQLSQISTILENLTSNVEALTNELSDIGRLSQFDNIPPFEYDQIYEPTEHFTNFNPLNFRF
jgi:archaellum component FlaC